MLDVHPELAPILERLPERPENPYADIEALRADFRALIGERATEPDPRVTTEPLEITGAAGQPLDGQIVRPRSGMGPRDASGEGPRSMDAHDTSGMRATSGSGAVPGVLYLHGGGFAYGELDGPSPMVRDIAATVGAVVVNPHYRLAPEHRFPAGVEDCYATLTWFAEHAGELGVDPARIAVCGASAGGNLAAALTLMSRDRGGPAIAFQSLLIPVLDDRGDTPSRRAIVDRRIINGPRHRPHLGQLSRRRPRPRDHLPLRRARASGRPPRPAAGLRPRLRTRSAARRGSRLRRPPRSGRHRRHPAPRARRLALLRGVRARHDDRAGDDRPLARRAARGPRCGPGPVARAEPVVGAAGRGLRPVAKVRGIVLRTVADAPAHSSA